MIKLINWAISAWNAKVSTSAMMMCLRVCGFGLQGWVGGGRRNVRTWAGVGWGGMVAGRTKNVADAACQARVNEHVWMMEWCVRAVRASECGCVD
jgi:hypothetical protein